MAIPFEQLLAFGLSPSPGHLPTIRALLVEQTARERASQGEGDTELMRLAAAQLFNAARAGSGAVDDLILIWRAKRASMDAAGALDLEMLCGAGRDQTLQLLDAHDDGAAAAAALRANLDDDFDVDDYAADLERYYA